LSTKKPIVVVGSINTDLVAVTKRIPVIGETVIASDFQTHPGGKGANQAVGVARLGYPVQLIGRLGNDAFGTELRTYLQNAGVDVGGVATSDGVSGTAIVIVSERGDNSIVVAPGANSKVTPADLDANISLLKNAGMVLAQLEIPLNTIEHLASICARENVPLILDPAPAQELPADILQNITWFTPNQTEAAFYLGGKNSEWDSAGTAQTFLAKGCSGVVLKMGAEGTYLLSRQTAGSVIPAFSVNAVDTTAAGDAFNAGFATGLMLGKSPQDAATFAAAVAAISVTRSGAQPSMPNMNEVEEFLKSQSQNVATDLVEQ
jgi:ribokinase